ncbi:MAG: pyridoxamine 5'-phosphate oxidase family protein [Actinomycetota bacterium]|nr:pyridoxamine 5'-phosphate oxidase family protein [Actinomycetota bacterium]
MGKVLDQLDDDLIRWIGRQHLFFVATAPDDGGHVNLSPKGLDSFRVIDPSTVAYLDLTGSGVETIAHLRQNRRMTIMFCAFSGPPQILRLFGEGEVVQVGQPGYVEAAAGFPDLVGARAVITLHVERIQTSCGYAVPKMDFVEDREVLTRWAERKGDEGLTQYREQKNLVSIDGLPGLDP